MKTLLLLFAVIFSVPFLPQSQAQLPHGTIYGTKPSKVAMVEATKLEAFMNKETRTSTTVHGRVIKVTKEKGGWFDIDAGGGKVIAAHFKNYGINTPASLAGHMVIAEGVAQKTFIADDLQHFAGDTVTGKKQHQVKTDPKRRLTFEVTGLMVE
ncbi:MAG TPA: DUF4920 domain-containing protein [Mucilaginibacter sp.]|jgi:hypothetical protein|nr:DUF4920 domain-containing protein [Mucilaginibacter sp.]